MRKGVIPSSADGLGPGRGEGAAGLRGGTTPAALTEPVAGEAKEGPVMAIPESIQVSVCVPAAVRAARRLGFCAISGRRIAKFLCKAELRLRFLHYQPFQDPQFDREEHKPHQHHGVPEEIVQFVANGLIAEEGVANAGRGDS